MAIRAVLWDIDDTLFDYTGSDRTGVLRHLAAEGLLTAQESEEHALRLWGEVMESAFGRFLAGELGFLEHRRERARGFLGEPLPDDEADAWFGRYVEHYEAAWTLFPDALPALDALADGYRHGVLSNSSLSNQDRKLRILGLRDRFEVLLCADELGCAKPAAEAFLAGCDALGLPPEQVAYVGDRVDVDARGATEAGLLGIWLDRADAGDVSGLPRITGLDRLPALLRGDTRFGAPSTIG
ncbi:HAD family hydrolase [Streptomyces sp. NPDC002055]|uniref:HAD family hydrolase n=1 Tax=Streptomyces sp. NPDC002055 TaxID=3154534 RepID=UPI003325222E